MIRIGTQHKLDANRRQQLLDALSFWHRTVGEHRFFRNRTAYEQAFYCLWDGQDVNGLHLDTKYQLAWPFHGSSDQRLRWGERIYRDILSLLMISISSAEIEFTCDGGPEGEERAGALKRLLQSLMLSLGSKGMAEVMALMHYYLVDTPACGALAISWKQRRTIGIETFDRDTAQAGYVGWRTASGEIAETSAAQEFLETIEGVAAGEKSKGEELLRTFLVDSAKIFPKDVNAVIRAIAKTGDAIECRKIVDTSEGPEIDALRYGDDFCIPTITSDFDYASPWFRGEWLTESQLREHIADDDWDPEWVRRTLDYKGMDFYNANGSTEIEDFKDLVNIVWCYEAETNDAGETTRWVSVISLADGSAFGRRVLNTRRGKWDIAFFRGEVRNSNILDARGLAEIAAPAQGVAKHVRDMSTNNAIVGSLPPIKAKGARNRNVLVEPFVVLPMGQSDDVAFMQPPAYPASADKAEEKIKEELFAYVGVRYGEMDNEERRRQMVEWFLAQWRDFLVQLVEIAQDNASDAYIMRATATKDAAGLKAQDIAGAFTIALKLDPANLNNDELIKKVNAAAQVLNSMDRKNVVDTSPFVRHFFTMLFPEMANTALRSESELVGDDERDEENNFIKIKAGIVPSVDVSGKWNYEARLAWHQRMQQENPDALAEMTPASQQIYQNYLQQLQAQYQQYVVNAETGRQGVERTE